MTRGRTPPTPRPTTDPKSRSGGGGTRGGGTRGGAGAAMRIIVPLQGVVQGRSGIVLGSIIPCALFYFFQLYLKRNRSPPAPSSPRSVSPPSPPPSSSSGNLADLPRSHSRTLLASPRGSAPAQVSSRASSIARSPDSAYYAGLRRCSEDPYDPVSNPEGIIQLGLAENKLSLDLLWEWLSVNLKGSVLDEERPELSISGLAAYQPFDGLMDLKMMLYGDYYYGDFWISGLLIFCSAILILWSSGFWHLSTYGGYILIYLHPLSAWSFQHCPPQMLLRFISGVW